MPEDPVTFPQLVPPLGDELMADQALDAVAAQVPETPDLATEVEAEEPQPYGMTWQWDFANNRFVGPSPQPQRDLDSLRCWAQNVLQIGRAAHPIYDDEIGVDVDTTMIGDLLDDPASQHLYMEAVAEALLVHDRVTAVTNFDFSDDPAADDATDVAFEIHTDGGDVVAIDTVVEGP